MVDVRSEAEIIEKGKEYIRRIMSVQKDIANLNVDIKEIIAEAKLDGVPIGKLRSTVAYLKKQMKKTDADRAEDEIWQNIFQSDENIMHDIQELNNIS